ncbi:MAG: TIR domain-containing protein [Burkholderiales bacterium]|nr:TIR domain-containing protein [Anaerolineae bacterium]
MENIRIFLIVDDEQVRHLLTLLLPQLGFTLVGTAVSADEALSQVQQLQNEIDVVIVESFVPDSGPVITTIVDNAPRIAVVVLYAPASDRVRNVAYLDTPLTPERLTAAIRYGIRQRQERQQQQQPWDVLWGLPPIPPAPPTQAAPPPPQSEPVSRPAPSLWDRFGESLNNIKEDVKKALGGDSGETAGRGGQEYSRPTDDQREGQKGAEAPRQPHHQQSEPPPPPAPSDMDDQEPIYRGIPKEAFEEAEQAAPPPFSRPPSSVPPPAPSPAPITPPTSSVEPPEPAPEIVAPGAAPSPSHDIQFSAYYPREIKPMDWQPLIAYLFKQSAGPEVSTDAKKLLGDRTDIRTTQRPATQAIAEGATIMATPNLDGFQFNPPSISVGFFEDWHRFDFKLRAKDAPLDQAANGFVTFTVEGIIVADVPLSIFVTESVSAATQQAESLQKPYQAIFCSYSHKDTNIIERVERAYKALGMDYLRDVTTLKSGQEWNAELLKMIERADIFQLFWSSNSSMSKYVAQEYEHALNLKRPGPFVRPVYWEQPMPKVPDPLRPFHFAFEPTLDDDLPPPATIT